MCFTVPAGPGAPHGNFIQVTVEDGPDAVPVPGVDAFAIALAGTENATTLSMATRKAIVVVYDRQTDPIPFFACICLERGLDPGALAPPLISYMRKGRDKPCYVVP